MFININRRELVEGLRNVAGPAVTKQGFAALSSVFIEASSDKLKMTTTDLDVTMIGIVNARVDSAGKALVPMRRFMSVARELPSGDVVLEKNKNILSIKCEKVEFKINTIKEDEFPTLPERKEAVTIKILPEILEEMINLTSFCVGYEDVNYVLSGVLFELEGSIIKLVATDGRRLACIEREFPANQAELKEKISFILPSKTVNEVLKTTKDQQEPLHLLFTEKTTEFDFKGVKIISRPIEGEFPNYSQYIPKQQGNRLVVDRENFMAALKRIGLLTTSEHQGVKLSIKKNKIIIYKVTPQLGEAKEEVDAQYQSSPLDIEFNPNYFLDALKQLTSQEVTIDFFGPEKPAVLKKEGYIYLLLPIKT